MSHGYIGLEYGGVAYCSVTVAVDIQWKVRVLSIELSEKVGVAASVALSGPKVRPVEGLPTGTTPDMVVLVERLWGWTEEREFDVQEVAAEL